MTEVAAPVQRRAATPEDIDAIVALERVTQFAPHWPRTTYAEILQPSATDVRRWVIVAEQNRFQARITSSALTGFLVYAMQGDEAEIESVVVAAAAQGKGIGTALTRAALADCAAGGARHITLEVRASNRSAITLYRSLGFAQVALRAGYYRDPGEEGVVMQLKLG